METFKITTDETLRETIQHGNNRYPFAYYPDNIWKFVFHRIDWHWHTEWEFVYVEFGSMTVCVGESMFTLSEGNGIFINSKILHKFYSSDETVIPNFLCMPSFLAPENSLIYQKYIQPIVSSSLSYLILNGENLWQGEALEIMKQIFSAQAREGDGELFTSVLMQKLWLIIYENIDKTCMEEQTDDSGSAQARLQLIMQFLHQNYA